MVHKDLQRVNGIFVIFSRDATYWPTRLFDVATLFLFLLKEKFIFQIQYSTIPSGS